MLPESPGKFHRDGREVSPRRWILRQFHGVTRIP
jgi:hypothetical protein